MDEKREDGPTIDLTSAPELADHFIQIRNWDRYELLEFLGEGGMGQVYKAFDPKLKRYVALKFLRSDEGNRARRFLKEAQAQARIQHEHVCKIYEVGEVDGKQYIAMQYIEGVTLDKAAASMTVGQKAMVIKQVADGLQAAHGAGLIHRDIKPQNILVERKDKAEWHSYLADFGLVRILENPRTTQTGVIVGTPAFMAPEQACGEIDKLDHRTDIYGLGATTYTLLSGRFPFEGQTPLEVLSKVTSSEPQRLRRINPNIPVDLETIVMKCMEKDPRRRYDSARSLSEDLQQYLNGEPIHARPISWTYRLRKRVTKHKALTAVMGIAVLLILILAGTALRIQQRARLQAKLTYEFGQEAKYIQELLRHAYTAPKHDVRNERRTVLKLLQKIEERSRQLGDAGFGPSRYALGVGYVALQEYEKARQNLEDAWNAGFQMPEVAYALGRAMGAQYQRELEETERITNKELKEARKGEIQKSFRDPALSFLRIGHQAPGEAPEYVEALIAYYDKKYALALKQTESAFKKIPWLYEAKILQGDIHEEIGNGKRDVGDYDAAEESYIRADTEYQAALKIAESDPRSYEGLCDVGISKMILEMISAGDPEPYMEEALAYCDSALKVDPEKADIYTKQSLMYERWGEFLMGIGNNPYEALDKAAAAARQAINLESGSADAHYFLGNAYAARCKYDIDYGLDPRVLLGKAIESYERAVKIDKNHALAYQQLGVVYEKLWNYELDHGLNPSASLAQAIRCYKKSLEIYPNRSGPYIELGNAHIEQGSYELIHGLDVRTALTRALQHYERAIQMNPNSANAFINIGSVYVLLAQYEMANGLDPRASLSKATESLKRAGKIRPNHAYVYFSLIGVQRISAEYEWLQGADPREELQLAFQAFEKGTAIIADDALSYIDLAATFLFQARYVMDQGNSPEEIFNQAEALLKKAIQMNATEGDAYRQFAEKELLTARWKTKRGKGPDDDFQKALSLCEKAVATNSRYAENYFVRAKSRYYLAEWRLRKGLSTHAEIQEGLDAINKALEINPRMAHAFGIRGLLLLLQSRTAKNEEAAHKAQESIQEALRINPNLKREYGDQ